MLFVRNILVALMGLSCAVSPVFAAGQCSAKSGAETAALLELYTSEGCNSCPPADRWVSSLTPSGFKANQLVPLAFHVDYWDYIGWADRFADPSYGGRHRDLARANGSGTVYTPQIFVNGKDIRLGLNNVKLTDTLKQINPGKPRADIGLQLDGLDPGVLKLSGSATLADAAHRQEALVFVAVYENHLVSHVKAGENRGVRLKHDYVVRELIGPLKFDGQGKLDIKQTISLKPDWKLKDLGVAAFVQQRDSGDTMQALQLPICM
ncbi:MAG: DUF1223 domain-containing protein [Burkholderiales bacterium]